MALTAADLLETRLALVFQANVEGHVSWSVLVGSVRSDDAGLVLDLGRHGVIRFRESWLERVKRTPFFMGRILLGAGHFLVVGVETPPPEADLRWYVRSSTEGPWPN